VVANGVRRQCYARIAGADDEMEASTRKVMQGYGSSDGDSDSNGRKKRANGVNSDPSFSIYRGSTGSACCGSFCRTTRTTTAIT
jgi:hypothetical protein